MEEMHCQYCFKTFARVEKHELKCAGPTVAELSRVVRQLVERVDAQDRLIAEMQKRPRKFPPPATVPVLTEADLKVFLCEGVDAMVAPHSWPVASVNKVSYVCEEGEWVRATDAQLKAVATAVIVQLTQLFPAYVDRKGWMQHDPKNLYPEKSLKVYGIQPSAVQKALLKK